MAFDAQAHYALQVQQLQKNLKQSEQDLRAARRAMEEQRQIIIGLGQAFAPHALAALSSAAEDEGAPPLKTMESAAIGALILRALTEKIAKLTAFGAGLSSEQRERWIQRTLETQPTDWVSDPALVDARRAVESERLARLAAEQAARDAVARAKEIAEKQATAGPERLRLLGEMRTLQEQLTAAQAQLLALRSGSPDLSTASPSRTTAISPAAASAPVPVPSAGRPGPLDPAGSEASGPTLLTGTATDVKTPEDSLNALVLVVATRGVCERPRLAEILHGEFGFGDTPSHFLINTAFTEATEKRGLLEVVEPHPETGVGRAPHLVRLSDAGRQFARDKLGVEPVPSELDKLLKLHDTPEHALLVLQTRALFVEKYPEPVATVEIFPAPVFLDGGKRSEPDLAVTLPNGTVLLIECERDTPKNEAQRTDKWAKYYQATRGEFCVVCPDPRTLSKIGTEITVWQSHHGGRVHLQMTSVHQVLTRSDPNRFWVYDRAIG